MIPKERPQERSQQTRKPTQASLSVLSNAKAQAIPEGQRKITKVRGKFQTQFTEPENTRQAQVAL